VFCRQLFNYIGEYSIGSKRFCARSGVFHGSVVFVAAGARLFYNGLLAIRYQSATFTEQPLIINAL
jgi:hypothetical protein